MILEKPGTWKVLGLPLLWAEAVAVFQGRR